MYQSMLYPAIRPFCLLRIEIIIFCGLKSTQTISTNLVKSICFKYNYFYYLSLNNYDCKV